MIMHCYIISGSPDADIAYLRERIRPTDHVICADLGCRHALRAGITPDLAVGDFDSCTDLPQNVPWVKLPAEKDYTDTMHCICEAAARGFDSVTLLCALGARLDHSLCNLYALDFARKQGIEAAICSRSETVRLLTEGEYRFDGQNGKTFSLFPFGCERVTVTYTGARYPLTRGTLASEEAIGVSNIFITDSASVTVHSGKALLIINEQLPECNKT